MRAGMRHQLLGAANVTNDDRWWSIQRFDGRPEARPKLTSLSIASDIAKSSGTNKIAEMCETNQISTVIFTVCGTSSAAPVMSGGYPHHGLGERRR